METDILKEVRKLGGIGLKKAIAEGLGGEAARFGHKEAITTGLIRVEGGNSFNDLCVSLIEEHIIPEDSSTNELIDRLEIAVRDRGEVVLGWKHPVVKEEGFKRQSPIKVKKTIEPRPTLPAGKYAKSLPDDKIINIVKYCHSKSGSFYNEFLNRGLSI